MAEVSRTESRSAPPLIEDESIIKVPTSKIFPMPGQPRQWFDPIEIESLAASIREHGQRTPVQVIKVAKNGNYQLKSGERRLRACRKIEEQTGAEFFMRAIVEPSHGEEADFEEAVIENLHREDMQPLEIAQSLARLKARRKRSIETLANMFGKSTSYIENYLLLNTLPDTVKALMDPARPPDDRLRVSAAFEIARINDPELQFDVADHAVNARLTVRDTVHLIEARAHERGVDITALSKRKRERKPSDDHALLQSFMTRTASFLTRADKRMDFSTMYASLPDSVSALQADLDNLNILKKQIDTLSEKMAAKNHKI